MRGVASVGVRDLARVKVLWLDHHRKTSSRPAYAREPTGAVCRAGSGSKFGAARTVGCYASGTAGGPRRDREVSEAPPKLGRLLAVCGFRFRDDDLKPVR